jgi:hypothetical protein
LEKVSFPPAQASRVSVIERPKRCESVLSLFSGKLPENLSMFAQYSYNCTLCFDKLSMNRDLSFSGT